MSAARPRGHHELDGRLANSSLFGWLGPAFRLAAKHWPFSLGAGLAGIGVATMTVALPGVPYWGVSALFVNTMIHLSYEALAASLVTVVAYQLLAEKEGVGAVNEWRHTLIRTVQITGIWLIAACIVGLVQFFLARAGMRMSIGALSRVNDVAGLAALVVNNSVWGLVIGVVVFLLLPIATALGVAGALSTVYAVRSRDTALDAVRKSLQLAFGEIWRVVWPTYVLAILWILLSFLVLLIALFGPTPGFGFKLLLGSIVSVCTVAYGIGMMFVIERTYAPHLTQLDDEAASAPAPAHPRDQGVGPQAAAQAGAAAASPASTLEAQQAAGQLAEDLRTNRTQRLVESVEGALAADARFFVSQPDSTLAMGKRLVAQGRPDLALRVIQPYLKEHRAHRQHFTTALFVADVLARDPRRLAEAARFLAQVKALYPREPMVDQLIKTTERAIAAAKMGGADPRGSPA